MTRARVRLGGRRARAPVAVIAAAAAAVIAAATLRWLYSVVTVYGSSMEPGLADGDRLVARRCGVGRLRPGQLVVFTEPGLPHRGRPAWLTGASQGLWVIKRVAAGPGDPVPGAIRAAVGGATVVPPRAVLVLGDGPGSRDSRQWGFITSRHIFGTARPRRTIRS